MSKTTAESSHALSIFWLKKQGFLDSSYKSGFITWTYGLSENKSSVGFSIVKDSWDIAEENTYIELKYTHTDRWTEEKSDMDVKITLTATPCSYGGKRYWFVCPLTKNGRYCGRRVGVIYVIGKWFGCRHCGEIAYQSQMYGGRYKGFVSIPDIEKAEKEVKRWHYRGKPTRKYRKVIKLNEKFESSMLMMAAKWKK